METQAINDNEKADLDNVSENLNNNDVSELTRSKRDIRKPSRFDDNYVYGCIYVNFCIADSPVNFDEAVNCYESSFWVEAMNKEMISLKKNKTWKLVE